MTCFCCAGVFLVEFPGKSSTKSNTVSVQWPDLVCPKRVDKTNWLRHGTHGDWFTITVSGNGVTATRGDAAPGWGYHFDFTCRSKRRQPPACPVSMLAALHRMGRRLIQASCIPFVNPVSPLGEGWCPEPQHLISTLTASLPWRAYLCRSCIGKVGDGPVPRHRRQIASNILQRCCHWSSGLQSKMCCAGTMCCQSIQ